MTFRRGGGGRRRDGRRGGDAGGAAVPAARASACLRGLHLRTLTTLRLPLTTFVFLTMRQRFFLRFFGFFFFAAVASSSRTSSAKASPPGLRWIDTVMSAAEVSA